MDRAAPIAGRFELEQLAGTGGMGSVYRARDLERGALVALKLLVAEGEGHRARFVREAEVLASLSHPGIVRYVAHGATPEGRLYLAMEWLEGPDLAARLRTEGLGLDEGLGLARRVAEALGHAHARGVVHRDVKPSNLLLVDGRPDAVRVLDFGIARFGGVASRATQTGAIVGTPGYLAPEQARGDVAVTAASDVFSLGCVLFEILTGRPPFVGDHMVAVLAKILVDEAPRARSLREDVPPALDELLARLLAKDPDERPRDGAEVVAALDALGELGAAGGSAGPTRESVAALTTREQRVVSVLLAAPDGASVRADAPTLGLDDARSRVDRLRDTALRFGARYERLADGTALAMMSGGAATDLAARAARCALALRDELSGVPTVLATGRGVVGERLPLGDVIDRAAGLLRAARARGAGALLLDASTAGLLDARFDVRGAEGDPARELVAERGAEETGRTLLGRSTRCVGRDRELAMLEGVFDECAGEPMARAVLVTAPPGAGKSRLRHELLRRLALRADAPEVWLAAGDPVGARSPLGLVAQWIRRACGVVEGEPLAARREKLRARFARGLRGAALERAMVFLGDLVGVPPLDEEHAELRAARRDAKLLADQLRRAWESFLAASFAASPLVLVLEDLHFGDLASLQLTEWALRRLEDRPLLLLALGRPETHEIFPRLFAEGGLVGLPLKPLPRRAAEELVREALGNAVKSAAIAEVVARAEGNPLYLEELVRAFASGKSDALPETVLGLVAARLDRFEPEARRVLRAASIFGEVFFERGVTALLGGVDRTTQVGDRLRRLVDDEVLVLRGEERQGAGQGFAFRHALLREASYAALTEADRALGHRLAARWLTEHGQDSAAVLGEHFARGGEPLEAARWFAVAAEQALGGSDLDAALAWSRRAVEAGASGAELGAVRRVEASARHQRGENAEAADAGEQAVALLPLGSARWHDAVADLSTVSARLARPLRLAAMAHALHEAPFEPSAASSRAVALARTAMHLLQAGEEALVERLRHALDTLPLEAPDPGARAWLDRLRAVLALHGGDPAAYLELTRRVVKGFEDAGDRASACAQRGNLGYAYMELGAYDQAEAPLREGLDAATQLGLRHNAALIRHNLGFALARRGALEEGVAVERDAAAALASQGHLRLEAFARAYLARIAVLRGDRQEADDASSRALRLAEETPPVRALALAVRAEVLLFRGEDVAARDAAREASALLRALGGIEEGESLIRLMEVETLAAVGELAPAREALARALSRLDERAGKISHAELRASFLERVPENARTRALAAAPWAVERRGTHAPDP